jgi:hypothetical protein
MIKIGSIALYCRGRDETGRLIFTSNSASAPGRIDPAQRWELRVPVNSETQYLTFKIEIELSIGDVAAYGFALPDIPLNRGER